MTPIATTHSLTRRLLESMERAYALGKGKRTPAVMAGQLLLVNADVGSALVIAKAWASSATILAAEAQDKLEEAKQILEYLGHVQREETRR